MPPHPSGPVQPITIVRAAFSVHFDVTTNRCFSVHVQGRSLRRLELPSLAVVVPIFSVDPFLRFVWMSAFHPRPEFFPKNVLQFAERSSGGLGGIVPTPAPNNRVEYANQFLLCTGLKAVNDFSQFSVVTKDCVLAGTNQRKEWQLFFTVRIPPGTGPTSIVWT